MASHLERTSLLDPSLVRAALRDSVRKLAPAHVARNPVMFVVEVGSVVTTLLLIRDVVTGRADLPASFTAAVALFLWFTVLFANFAEAIAEGRGKAQADSLRKMRRDI